MSNAILLIAHGSRLPSANEDLRKLAVMMSERRPDDIIECAYLELTEPSIPQGIEACVKRGAGSVRMLPYFLSAGAHVTRDLEEFRQQFGEEYPEVDVTLCPPIGLHPDLVDILLERLDESSQPSQPSA